MPRWECDVSESVNTRIASLLAKVGEVHHAVFADTDGNDDDWASFYSDWLLTHSELPRLLARRPVRSHLTGFLVDLDAQYTKLAPADPWPAWYADRLIAAYG
jgi:hypothetical protein